MFAVGGRHKCISTGDTVGGGSSTPPKSGEGNPFTMLRDETRKAFFLPASEQRAQVNAVVREVERDECRECRPA